MNDKIGIRAGLTLALALWVASAAAESNVAAPFLQKGTGGRAMGMGTCFTAVAEGPFGFIYNPAGLAEGQSAQVGFQHEGTAYDLQHESLAGRFSLGSGSMGVLFNYFDYGQIERRDSEGQLTGETLDLNDVLFDLGYGLALDSEWRVGANAGFYSLNLGTQILSGVTADLGVGWTMNPAWTLGVVIKNIGTSVEGYSLPSSMRVAAAWRAWERRLLLDVELDAPLAQDPFNFGLGAEYRIWDWMDVRLGFKTPVGQAQSAVETLRLGVGFNYAQFGFDLTLGGRGDFGGEVVLGLVYDFASPRPAPKTPPLSATEKKPAASEVPRISADPTAQAQFHYQAGQEYERYGQIIDAIVEYKAALQLVPDYADAKQAIVAARQKAKEMEAEQESMQPEAAGNESLQKTIRKYYEKGLAAYKEKDYSEAIKQLQLVLDFTTQHREATDLLAKARSALRRELAILDQTAARARAAGDLAEEIDAYAKMLDLDPEDSKLRSQLESARQRAPREVERLYKLGLDEYAKGSYREALTAFEKVIKIQPDHVKAKDAVKNIKEKLVQTGQ